MWGKLQLKKGRLSKLVEITEENLTLSPIAYWDRFLSVELAATVKDKLPDPRYEPDEITVVVSVEKRSERNLRKRFDGLIVDWKTIEDKLRSWAPLFREESKKHYKLDTNILGMLVDFAEGGNLLRTHDDVPENIRQVIYKHEEESSERRKLKRKRSDSSPPISIHVTCPGHPGQHSGEMFTEPNVEARGEAQGSDQMDSPRWQQSIQHAYEITREACLDLKHVHAKVGVEFYTDKGVQLGVALSFINDVPRWVEETLG
ncbi:hypothetical protein MRS44_018402 [Fusarium solani]|uniref:uncharacterized protein n=1 Tax=Fusarium solani TaxID=169388 RepID=UPI0032C41156|nr:hypothetical protein MRS44_018402 [Fusarium solani]